MKLEAIFSCTRSYVPGDAPVRVLIEFEACEEVLGQQVHGAPWRHDLDRALERPSRSRPPLQSAQARGSLIGGGGRRLLRERRPPGLQPEALVRVRFRVRVRVRVEVRLGLGLRLG